MGKLLARMLEYPFLDSDTLIEQLSKKQVSEIFAEDGEDYFRELETSVLKVRLCYCPQTIPHLAFLAVQCLPCRHKLFVRI